MLVDRYTKTVLTLIAAALMALAVGQFMPKSAVAQAGTCGTPNNPCYVTNDGLNDLGVDVNNIPRVRPIGL
jgi:hypothetical protein